MTVSPPPHIYPSLKRAFQSERQHVQEFKDDMQAPKPTINQDHRLLSFGKLQDKHTIIDGQGRVQEIELTAQIHGIFVLSELATPAGENQLVQPELTCYRRNLFNISGSVTTPRSSLSIMTKHNNRIPIVSLEVVISATESVDSHIVKLIVIPLKTETATLQEREPTPIPLLPFDEGPDANPDITVYPIAYQRLQFKNATAHNGRKQELHQYFTLHLNIEGTLANGMKLTVCETATAPIVVRGRSPKNFEARKDTPLGSSSSGTLPAKLRNIISNNGGHNGEKMAKPQMLELPKSGTISEFPLMIRPPDFLNATHTPDHTTAPNTPNYPAPSLTLPSSHSPATIPTSGPLPINPQNAFHLPFPFGFTDYNSRPTKLPRLAARSNAPRSYLETSSAAPYSQARFNTMPSRESVYLPTMNQPWTSRPEEAVYWTIQQPDINCYNFRSEQS